MDPYGIKYQIKYLRRRGTQTTIDILQKNYSGAITQLQPSGNPLEISYEGDESNIYKPTVGSGATIQVMATPLSLQELFTTDPQEFKVMIYTGESEDSSGGWNDYELMWQGFVNAGIYTESYSYPMSLLAPITIHCNDGMAVLDDLPYTDGIGGASYTGVDAIGTVMQRIFAKLNLEFYCIRQLNDLKWGVNDEKNFLVGTSVNNENYYDEEGVAMSCREVIEAIMGGIGVVFSLKGAYIYMVDPINLESPGWQWWIHPTWGTTRNVFSMGYSYDISAGDINWYKTGQEIDLVVPTSYIDVTYDPYTFTERGYDFNDPENITDPGNYGEYTTNGITYRIFHDIDMKGWTCFGGDKFEAFQQIAPDSEDKMYVIRQEPGYSSSHYYEYTFPFSCINKDIANTLYLELSMDVYVNTEDYGNIWVPVGAHHVTPFTWLNNMKMKMGTHWLHGEYGGSLSWQDAETTFVYGSIREYDAKVIAGYYVHGTWFRKPKYVMSIETSDIGDMWTTAYMYIPLSHLGPLFGDITLRIPKLMDAINDNDFKNILIKNVNIAVVNASHDPVYNDGILTSGVIDAAASLKKSGLDVSLKHGVGPYGASKGAFINSDPILGVGELITGYHRQGGANYTPAKLLLQDLMSEYGSQRYKLTGTLDVMSYSVPYVNYLMMKPIEDNDHLSGKRFMIVKGTYNDREEYLNATLIELAGGRQTIT
jgi:hypothetical protein